MSEIVSKNTGITSEEDDLISDDAVAMPPTGRRLEARFAPDGADVPPLVLFDHR